jgi:hypothetical protein
MSERTAMDQIGLELHEMAEAYSARAAQLASDPYFRTAIVKVAVSGFVWALYDAFEDDFGRAALHEELKIQEGAVGRAIGGEGEYGHA